ncbi:RICIN domain-containing protein [Streptomyces sp. DH10]|uniref:RICIN domain-containing protein n=1 Tax=Streptomyces sp. DH10 TaxID=3040121 RepID=UPI002442439D|nr:hypothetical protein [Streptomyces sp. DH10]MDG9711412.1 hypothetical protein [Streptomyces sp. DH10]
MASSESFEASVGFTVGWSQFVVATLTGTYGWSWQTTVTGEERRTVELPPGYMGWLSFSPKYKAIDGLYEEKVPLGPYYELNSGNVTVMTPMETKNALGQPVPDGVYNPQSRPMTAAEQQQLCGRVLYDAPTAGNRYIINHVGGGDGFPALFPESKGYGAEGAYAWTGAEEPWNRSAGTWAVQSAGNGNVRIVSEATGTCLTLAPYSATRLFLFKCDGRAKQVFRTQGLGNGKYLITQSMNGTTYKLYPDRVDIGGRCDVQNMGNGAMVYGGTTAGGLSDACAAWMFRKV